MFLFTLEKIKVILPDVEDSYALPKERTHWNSKSGEQLDTYNWTSKLI